METWEIDFIQENGSLKLQTRILGSGVLWTAEVKRPTPDQVMRSIREKIRVHGRPDKIVTDKSDFVTRRMARWFEDIGVRHEIR